MVNPKTGWVTREWEVETFANVPFAGGKAVFSSTKHPVVSEAVFLGGVGTVGEPITGATVIAHDRSIPDQGSIAATQAATLAPQQFIAGFYGLSPGAPTIIGTTGGTVTPTLTSGTIGGSVVAFAVFAVRGR